MATIRGLVNNDIDTAAAIAATKLQGEFNVPLTQTGTVVAATQYVHVVRGVNGQVVALQAAITETIATGGDRTVTLDLARSTGAGAFASILSSTLVFTSASVLRTVSTASLSSSPTALVAGDILRLTVAVAGAAGNQALGLAAAVILREDAA